MAYVTGTATTIYALLTAVNTLVTTGLDVATNWTLERSSEVNGEKSECIWRGVGKGQDKIYVGARVVLDAGEASGRLELNGFAGYDAKLDWADQPSAITKSIVNGELPTLPLTNNATFSYWIFVNSQRIIITVKMATQYESAYLGFFNPVSVERQYPYPMVIAGSAIGGQHWSVVDNTRGSIALPATSANNATVITSYQDYFPVDNKESNKCTMRVRLPDGRWKGSASKGNVVVNGATILKYFPFAPLSTFPYTCGQSKLSTIYKQTTGGQVIEDYILFPVTLVQNYPNNILGDLDGVYFISGTKDIATEQVLIFGGMQYIVFDTMNTRGANSYFVVRLN